MNVFCTVFRVLFQYLVQEKDINMEAIHSEHPAYKSSTYGSVSKKSRDDESS